MPGQGVVGGPTPHPTAPPPPLSCRHPGSTDSHPARGRPRRPGAPATRPSRVRPGGSCAAQTQPRSAPRRRPRHPLPCALAPSPPPPLPAGTQDPPRGAAGTGGSRTPPRTALPIRGPGLGGVGSGGREPASRGAGGGGCLPGETEARSSREEAWGLEGPGTTAGR